MQKNEKAVGRWFAAGLAAWVAACWLTLTCPPANGAEVGGAADLGLAQRLAAATPGQLLSVPAGADYRRPPAGLRPVSFPVAVGYKLTVASGTQWITLVEGEPAMARPGLVAKVTGTVAGQAVMLNYLVCGIEERELDVPQPAGVPSMRQRVPYILTWGPLEPQPTDVVGIKLEVVVPAQPVRPTATTAPQLTAPRTATAASASTVEPRLSAAPAEDAPATPTASATAPPAEPRPADAPAPAPTQMPAASQSGTTGNWVMQRRALAAAVADARVGQVLPSLPEWVTKSPASPPQQWGWSLTRVRVTDRTKFRPGQIVALVVKDQATGQAGDWVKGVVAGHGIETREGGLEVELAYIWGPTVLTGVNAISTTEPK